MRRAYRGKVVVQSSLLIDAAVPPVVMAKCLSGEVCRYHGKRVSRCRKLIEGLEAQGHRVVYVCPEMLGGLPCPRPPARRRGGRVWADGIDVTHNYDKGAAITLAACQQLGATVFYGVRNSPSCDPGGVTGKLLVAHGIEVISIWR